MRNNTTTNQKSTNQIREVDKLALKMSPQLSQTRHQLLMTSTTQQPSTNPLSASTITSTTTASSSCVPVAFHNNNNVNSTTMSINPATVAQWIALHSQQHQQQQQQQHQQQHQQHNSLLQQLSQSNPTQQQMHLAQLHMLQQLSNHHQHLKQHQQQQQQQPQNHLVCTCPPEVHKALLEQQFMQPSQLQQRSAQQTTTKSQQNKDQINDTSTTERNKLHSAIHQIQHYQTLPTTSSHSYHQNQLHLHQQQHHPSQPQHFSQSGGNHVTLPPYLILQGSNNQQIKLIVDNNNINSALLVSTAATTSTTHTPAITSTTIPLSTASNNATVSSNSTNVPAIPIYHPAASSTTSRFFHKSPESLPEAQAQISKMESQLIYLTNWIQSNLHIQNSSMHHPSQVHQLHSLTSVSSPYLQSTSSSSSLTNNSSPPYTTNSSTNITTTTSTTSKQSQASSSNSSSNSSSSSTICPQTINHVDGIPNLNCLSTSNSITSSHQQNFLSCFIVPSSNTTNNNNSSSESFNNHPYFSEANTPSNSSMDSAYSAKSIEEKTQLRNAQVQLESIKHEMIQLKKLNQSMKINIKDQINETFLRIQSLLKENRSVNTQPIRNDRVRLDSILHLYTTDVNFQIKKLEDLEIAIEDLRISVLNRRCRVNVDEVEVLALHLSRISKSLTTSKSEFPELDLKIRKIIEVELDLIKEDEKLIINEPKRLENALKMCKKLISTLFTLKRLGSVQETTDSDCIPEIRSIREPSVKDKQAVLDSIRSVKIDHEDRMRKIEQADRLRECRKNMLISHEALKFEKSLELAAKTLREINNEATVLSNGVITGPLFTTVTTTSTASPSTTTIEDHLKSSSKQESDSTASLTDSSDVNDPVSCVVDSNNQNSSAASEAMPVNSAHQHHHTQHQHYYNNNGNLKTNSHANSSSSDASNNEMDNSHSSSSDSHKTHTNNSNAVVTTTTASVISGAATLQHKQGTILKTGHNNSRSNRSSKVAFNRCVMVEGGGEYLQLNCLDDDYENDYGSLSLTSITSPPPPPPPRLSSQDEIVTAPELPLSASPTPNKILGFHPNSNNNSDSQHPYHVVSPKLWQQIQK